jgi:hypothetical protein
MADGSVLLYSALRGPVRKRCRFAGHSPMARPGLEPGTPRFSDVRSGVFAGTKSLETGGFSRGGRDRRKFAFCGQFRLIQEMARSSPNTIHGSVRRRRWWRATRAGARVTRRAARAGGRARRVPDLRRSRGRGRAARRRAGEEVVGAGDPDVVDSGPGDVEALLANDERDGCDREGERAHCSSFGSVVSVVRSTGWWSGSVTRPCGNASRR